MFPPKAELSKCANHEKLLSVRAQLGKLFGCYIDLVPLALRRKMVCPLVTRVRWATKEGYVSGT